MKNRLKYLSLLAIVFCFSCRKNPDTTMTFHVTKDTPGSYVINMTSQYKNDVESSSSPSFDKTLTVSGEYNVVASSWECHVSNSNNQNSNISITMTFNNGTPHTCTDSSHPDLWCIGQ